jgi:hypothetical protein
MRNEFNFPAYMREHKLRAGFKGFIFGMIFLLVAQWVYHRYDSGYTLASGFTAKRDAAETPCKPTKHKR